jgi:hypothetical protein
LYAVVQIEDDLTEEQMELLTDYGLEDFQDREQIKGTLQLISRAHGVPCFRDVRGPI